MPTPRVWSQRVDKGTVIAQRLSSHLDSALALEAIAVYLGKAGPSLGKAGLALANLAIESYTVKSDKDLPLAFALESENPLDGIDAVRQRIKSAWDSVDDNLSELMVSQVEKMESYKGRVAELRSLIGALSARVESMQPNAVPRVSALPKEFFLQQLSSSESGFSLCAADVVPKLLNLMTDHEKRFGDTVRRLVVWINEHQKELLDNGDVFENLGIDPAELLVLNAQKLDNAEPGFATYCTPELPGGYRMMLKLPAKPVIGMDAIDSIKNIVASLTQGPMGEPEGPYNVLTVREARKLVEGIQSVMQGLATWYELIYRRMWAADDYSTILCYAVMRGIENKNPGTREFQDLALSVFRLMHTATVGVDEYVLETLQALMTYLQECLKQYP